MDLTTPLKSVLHTVPSHLQALETLGIRSVGDLLLYLPRSHEDLSQIATIASCRLEEKVSIRGTVDRLKLVRTRHGKRLVTARFTDEQGDSAEVVWFNQPHILRMLPENAEVVLTGKLIENGMKLQMSSPQFERAGTQPLVHAGRLVPIYPQHDVITTKWLREKISLLRPAVDLLPETLPAELLKEENLLPRCEAVRALHFPENPEEIARAQERMAFEEMYRIQCAAIEKKRAWQGNEEQRLKIPMDIELIRTFFSSLKFTPTASQKIAIYEILKDMETGRAMSRLLEGDVGSGKTLVAAAVMANVIAHGGQCAFLVPTEVLARQHADAIGRMYVHFLKEVSKQGGENGAKITMQSQRIALLLGAQTDGEHRAIRDKLQSGSVDLVIGTHALLQEGIVFRDLRLVVVDEQHRFGVIQRELLREKYHPHFLAMTATPIPRTLALTAFGHHDLSVLTEKPGRREKIATKVVSPADRKTVERFIDREITDGRQVFVICPLIGDSQIDEMAEVKSVEREAERLRAEFPSRRIAALHGRMSSEEKEAAMQAFRRNETNILVSTSVIEVGIDVPNATVMVIEGAERFGLAQLHQFRGRVGRGEWKSHCFLFATSSAQANSPRLKAMEQYEDGFLLAEMDLKLRGPGELFGVRQSGIPENVFQMLLNPEAVVRARRAAEKYVHAG